MARAGRGTRSRGSATPTATAGSSRRPRIASGGAAAKQPTAARFIELLRANQSDEELAKIRRYFKVNEGEHGAGDTFLGVRMGTVFALARESEAMDLPEIEVLLESDLHEARAGALRIMAEQAKAKRTTAEHRQELYALYLRRMDRINNWDLVDLAAWDVVGRYLIDQPRDILYSLAASDNVWERRTAIYATIAFLRRGEADDAFQLAELLVDDPHDLVQKAVGGVLRWAGDIDLPRLRAFLDRHAATMPRVMLRYAIEHLDATERADLMGRRGTG